MPGGGRQLITGTLFVEDNLGVRLGFDLFSRNHNLVFLTREPVGFEDKRLLQITDLNRRFLGQAELLGRLEVVRQCVDHLGGRSRRLPVVQLLIEKQPQNHAIQLFLGRLEFLGRP